MYLIHGKHGLSINKMKVFITQVISLKGGPLYSSCMYTVCNTNLQDLCWEHIKPCLAIPYNVCILQPWKAPTDTTFGHTNICLVHFPNCLPPKCNTLQLEFLLFHQFVRRTKLQSCSSIVWTHGVCGMELLSYSCLMFVQICLSAPFTIGLAVQGHPVVDH